MCWNNSWLLTAGETSRTLALSTDRLSGGWFGKVDYYCVFASRRRTRTPRVAVGRADGRAAQTTDHDVGPVQTMACSR